MRSKAMILTRLKLKNFKCYTSKELEFSEGLTGIIGKNGSGKSTIFEGILFALYGELKNKKFKETIKNTNAKSSENVLVELDFEFENIEYKIERQFRGKALSASAKLYKNGQLIVSGAREVSAAVAKLTKMSKDAFLHTLFASQKELTSLSGLNNEDRKKMIRRLLGLEKIDFIESVLVEKIRELKREINLSAQYLLSDEDIEAKNSEIKKIESLKVDLEKKLKSSQELLQKCKSQEEKVEADLSVFVKAKEKKQKLLSEFGLIKNEINSTAQNRLKLEQELQNLKQKSNELKKYKEIKSEYESLQKELEKLQKLKDSHLKKEGLQKEQVQLRAQFVSLKNKIKALVTECEKEDKLKKQIEQEQIQLAKLTKEFEGLQKEQALLEQQLSAEERIVKDTKQKIAKIKALGPDSNCPTCTRKLLDEYDNVIQSLQNIVNESQDQKIKKIKIKLGKKEALIAQAQKQKEEFQKALHVKESELKVVQSKQKDLKNYQEEFEKIKKQGVKNKEEIEKLSTFTYDEALHVKLQEQFEKLKPKYLRTLELETELKREPMVQKELTLVDKQSEALKMKLKQKSQEVDKVVYDKSLHEAKEAEFKKIKAQKEGYFNEIGQLKEQVARYVGQINSLQESLKSNQAKIEKVQKKRDDLEDFEKIKVSFKEFKTRLNAKVAPRISQVASNMFSTITKGKYQYIEVSDDFDFFIFDDGKRYPIERFSGGEVDLANLVLRIAISKTLAELSGAGSVGFLAFDEVFGSQDEARRMQILEAFHTIKEQYRQIFLISHEMEIKEMFERVVEL
jgi:exonuclease SbcC